MIDKKETVYECSDLAVSINPPDEILAQAYQIMKMDGTLPILFYEGVPTLSWFLQHYTRKGPTVFACWVRIAQDTIRLAGFGCVNDPVGMGCDGYSKAEICVAFFREFQKRKYTIPLATMMLEYTFDRLPLHSVFGTTPDQNPAMLAFLTKLGFGHTAIPDFTCFQGVPCGVWISWMTRNMWQTRQNPDF